MRRLLIVVGPVADESLLALPASQNRTDSTEEGSQLSFWTEGPYTESWHMGSPRQDRSYERGER
jgi:hypothetical protein